MPSTRTQIYLTDEQRRRLDARGRRTGAPMARMIREAVDALLADDAPETQAALDETFGTVPELEIPDRSEWARDPDPGR
ncbi:MAG TPA: ribbon-helix-helix domain-containing protein [Candidatus Limnocylindria bacterium]